MRKQTGNLAENEEIGEKMTKLKRKLDQFGETCKQRKVEMINNYTPDEEATDLREPEPNEVEAPNENDHLDADAFESNNVQLAGPSGSPETMDDCSPSGSEVSHFFGLPTKLKKLLFEIKGIKSLYPWQAELMYQLTSHEKNVIYCIPTSGGKTLVAELMVMRELLLHKKSALLVMPYVSLVQEKVRHLSAFAAAFDFLAEEYAGPKGSIPPKIRRKYKSVYIATIEKAHLLITSLMQMDKLDEIGLVVVDELHMIGDGSSRGSVLEILLVKLKLALKRNEHKMRVLGMSATLSNLNDLCEFMQAEVFEQNYRPVVLREYVKCGRMLFEYCPKGSEGFLLAREIKEEPIEEDPESLRTLVSEVVPQNSCLIFCPTKKHCENIAIMLCKHLRSLVKHKQKEKTMLIKDIIAANNGHICPILRRSIPFGVVYHHSGLTSDERELIEAAFLSGVLSCIVCTSTLAAGVNLPAQRVIIRAPYVGTRFLTSARYKQMCGRAGRAGYSEVGESILITRMEEKLRVKELLKAPIAACLSSLKEDTNGLMALMLNLFELGFISCSSDLVDVISKETLYGIQSLKEDSLTLSKTVSQYLQRLLDLNLLVERNCSTYEITSLGKGVVRSLIDINRCELIYSQVKASLTAFNLSTDLHLLYLSTLLIDPADLSIYPDPSKFFNSYVALSDEEHRAAAVFGLKPGLVTRFKLTNSADDKIKRFYVTMIIDGVKKSSCDINSVALMYEIHRGTLQNCLNLVANCASSLQRFVAEIPEFEKLRSLLQDFPRDLHYCCSPELLPLVELPAVKMARARQLYQAGYKTLKDIATATVAELIQSIENLNKKQALEIIAKAKSSLLATADELQVEATELTFIATKS